MVKVAASLMINKINKMNTANYHENANYKNKHYVVKRQVNNITLKYNRASSIIVEESYNNNNGRNEPAIILFYCEKWDTFVEPGGRIEKMDMELDDILIETAKRELTEETLNSIGINKLTLMDSAYIDFNDKKTKFCSRVFTVGIKGNQFDKNYYYDNKEIILKNNVSTVWRETTNVERFYISDIIKSINDMNFEYHKYDNVKCTNVNDEICNIYYRTIGMLEQLINKNLMVEALIEPKEMISYDFYPNKFTEKFLIGTKTLEIKV